MKAKLILICVMLGLCSLSVGATGNGVGLALSF